MGTFQSGDLLFVQELFHDNADFVLHQDLLDSQLYICSPTVLHLFTDNFDYCSVEHFVKGILDNQEVGFKFVVAVDIGCAERTQSLNKSWVRVCVIFSACTLRCLFSETP